MSLQDELDKIDAKYEHRMRRLHHERLAIILFGSLAIAAILVIHFCR